MRAHALLVLCLLLPQMAGAVLIEDQRGLIGGAGVSGGFSSPIAQSFTPSVNSIAGIDVYLFNVAKFVTGGGVDTTANVTVSLYAASGIEDFSYASNPLLVSDSFFLDTAGTRSGYAQFRWSPFAITPETFYVMELTTDNGVFGAASTSPYARGQALESGLQRDYFDLDFISFYDDAFNAQAPLPASGLLLAVGLGVLGFSRRRGHA